MIVLFVDQASLVETCNRIVTTHLFWSQDGSDYYLTAQNLRKIFQEKFKKISIDPCRCSLNNGRVRQADRFYFYS